MAEAASRRRRALSVAGAALVVVVAVVLVGVPGLLRGRLPAPSAWLSRGAASDAGSADGFREGTGGAHLPDAAGVRVGAPGEDAPAAAGSDPPAGGTVAPGARGATGPIVAQGRTVLPGGAVAVRSGDTVAVHFDTPATRTRRPEKFERIVRATLPAIYGTTADSALAAVPEGSLASEGDLLTSLPERGVRLPTMGGDTLMVWPETRPGRDGPLVVTYRATILR